MQKSMFGFLPVAASEWQISEIKRSTRHLVFKKFAFILCLLTGGLKACCGSQTRVPGECLVLYLLTGGLKACCGSQTRVPGECLVLCLLDGDLEGEAFVAAQNDGRYFFAGAMEEELAQQLGFRDAGATAIDLDKNITLFEASALGGGVFAVFADVLGFESEDVFGKI